MPLTKDELLAEAKCLSPREREELAEELLEPLSDEDQASIDAAWLEEVKKREAEYLANGETSMDAEEFVDRLIARGRR